jgi:steroid delta-isomerase-like uncharacterized protein
MPADLVQFANGLLSAWNDHDIARILPFYAEDYQGEDVGQAVPILGHPGVERAFFAVLRAFPDLYIMDKELVAEQDRLAIAWEMRGCQRGAIMNIPPTGRRISVRGGSFYCLKNGKIARGLHIWDVAGLLRSLGLLPDL